ncbi:hypothetical protein H632_c3245p0 [Helicosporidium sp. ATCC 50920]|nr:hypothetical protein H632_c3245p0 [Helicosporidium sp. ATCC 50920]|eukprot:KDD72514.1 hypothetical protein H632_c3245p0 [Helicosporidium sp. ATCC 50920]
MDRLQGNFAKDGARMGCQLRVLRVVLRASDPELAGHLAAAGAGDMLCAYRWLLVLFKRELAFDQALRLWDALWTGQPCAHLPVLLAAGLLRRRREDILRGCRDADAVVQACLAWAGDLDVEEMLRDAADVYGGLGERTQRMLRELTP